MNRLLEKDLVPHRVQLPRSILPQTNRNGAALAQRGYDRHLVHVPDQNPGEGSPQNLQKNEPAQGLVHVLTIGADHQHFVQISAILVAPPLGHAKGHMDDRDLVPGLAAGIGHPVAGLPGLDLHPRGELIDILGAVRVQKEDIDVASPRIQSSPDPDPDPGRISGHVIKGQDLGALVAIEILVLAITSEYKR